MSDCGQYILVTTHQECRDNLLYFTKLASSDDITGLFNLTQVVYKFEHDFEYITNTGSRFLFRTNRNAQNYQLVIIDFDYTPTTDTIDKQVKTLNGFKSETFLLRLLQLLMISSFSPKTALQIS